MVGVILLTKGLNLDNCALFGFLFPRTALAKAVLLLILFIMVISLPPVPPDAYPNFCRADLFLTSILPFGSVAKFIFLSMPPSGDRNNPAADPSLTLTLPPEA